MKFGDLDRVKSVEPLLVRRSHADVLMGGSVVIAALERAGLLKPVHRGNRLTLFSYTDLSNLASRLRSGDINLAAVRAKTKGVE